MTYGGGLASDKTQSEKDLKQLMDITADFLSDFEPGRHLIDEFQWIDDLIPSWVPGWMARWRVEAGRRHDGEIEVQCEVSAGVWLLIDLQRYSSTLGF